MSFTRPSLLEIVTRVSADFVSRLELEGAVLLRSMINILSRVIAGASHMLHGHLDWVVRQIFPDLSDEAQLLRQCSLYGITKTPPSFALGTAGITGTGTPTVTAGSVLRRADGAEYTVDADVTITAGVGVLALTAKVAGTDGTLAAGVVLAFESPITGVDSTALVTASTVDGSDQERTSAVRLRLLDRMAEATHGGNNADYVAWAKEVAGVTRVWVTRLELGPGTVAVRFVRDLDGTGAAIIPGGGEVATVQAHLDVQAPAHATVTVIAPADAPIAYTIAVVPNTAEVKAAVAAELADLLRRTSSPGSTTLLSAQRTAIGSAAGLTDYTLTTPSADVTHTTNQLPSLGTITWV